MFKEVKEGQKVLLIWSGNAPAKHVEEIVHQLKSLTGTTGRVALEHEERLLLCKFKKYVVFYVRHLIILFLYCKLNLAQIYLADDGSDLRIPEIVDN